MSLKPQTWWHVISDQCPTSAPYGIYDTKEEAEVAVKAAEEKGHKDVKIHTSRGKGGV